MKTVIKNSILSGFVFFCTVLLLSVGYGALFGGLSISDKVTSGSQLTATSWNRIIDGVLDIDSRLSNLTFSGSNVGIGASPSTALEVNGKIKTSQLSVTNNPLNCQSVFATPAYIYKGAVSGYGSYSNIKRAACPAGTVLTSCMLTDYHSFATRIYSYTLPYFFDQNGTTVSGVGCQWINSFSNSTDNDAFATNANFEPIAICCSLN